MNDTQDGDYGDDHEPGDVNGNIDPAYARKQKQQARNQKRREARPERKPRPPRVPQEGAVAATKQPATATGASDGTDASAAMGGGSAEARNPSEQHGQQRARNPRRGGQSGQNGRNGSNGPNGRNDRNRRGEGGDRNGRNGNPVAQGAGPDFASGEMGHAGHEGQAVSANAAELVLPVGADVANGGELGFADDVGAAAAGFNPNPGAFGDPNRPMDRSARRNRNRRDKRSNPRDRNAQRAPQFAAPQVDAEGNPLPLPEGATVDAPMSGVNELGERDGERLHKVLAQQGLGSRRDMEALIEAGEVEVNGVKAHVGQVVNEKDRVHVKRRKVAVKLGDDKPRILIYHKQAGEIVSRDDPEQRDTVFDRLPKPDHGKWVAVGRLDYNSEGLLLFTTYGELANRFMHPRYEILREYSVRVLGELTPEQEDQLMDGIELEDGPARVLSLDRIDRDSDAANHWYRLTLNEGRNREVRRMFEHLGLTVSRLIRTSYGCVQMPSWLKRGQFKQLDEAETFNVLESVGLRSKKKLEKAARFGGRNKLPQQPLGPMRSATEHEAIWTGLPADGGAGQGRGRRQGGRGGANPGNAGNGFGGRSRRGGGRGSAGVPAALTQQQFPGFGGAAEVQPAGRRARTPGNKIKRGRDGEVNGNVAPGYRGNGGNAGNANGNGAAKRGRRRRGRGGPGGGARAEGAASAGLPMPDFE